MVRGKIVLATNKTTYTSVEFNGGMYWDWYGKEIVPALQKANDYKEYARLLAEFNSNNFEYPEQLTYNLRTFKARKRLRLFDMTTAYFQKWFSDYLYIKNISEYPITVKTRNFLILTLNPNGVLMLNFGNYTEGCREHSTNVKIDVSETLTDICENLGWWLNIYDTDIEIGQSSPLGEDFFFTVSKENFANNIISYAEDFDADEHAEMWVDCRGKRGVPSSIRDLIDDADDIKQMLTELSEQINNFLRSVEL
mgnify:CR=1 FL=1